MHEPIRDMKSSQAREQPVWDSTQLPARRGSFSRPACALQALHCNHDGRNDEGERPHHPHDRAGGDLVLLRREAEQAWDCRVRGIQHMIGEDENRRQHRVLEIAQQKIGDHGPARPLRMTRPGLHHGPPEDQRYQEETGVFEFVP
jgi:hypothetical protein